jgi:hypothetical protein
VLSADATELAADVSTDVARDWPVDAPDSSADWLDIAADETLADKAPVDGEAVPWVHPASTRSDARAAVAMSFFTMAHPFGT